MYTTDRMLLALRSDAKVYTVADNSRYLFVHLSGDNHPDESQIRVMAESAAEQLAAHHVLWPELECFNPEDDLFCGFLTRRIDLPEDAALIETLVENLGYEDDTAAYKLQVGLNLARCIRAVHQSAHRHVIGAPQPRDFHADGEGRVFFCNMYRCRLDLENDPASRYLAPEYINGQTGLTADCDAFSFALILFELLTGFFPFGAHEPETEFSGEEITDMVLNGESLFYFEYSPACRELEARLTAVSPLLPEMFRLAFDYCGRSRYEELRPSMADWIEVLEKIIENSK